MRPLFIAMLFVFFSIHSQELVIENAQGNLVVESEQQIQFHGDENAPPEFHYQASFMKMIFILLAIVALIFLTIWTFRRLSNVRVAQANESSSIKILEKRPLSPKSILYVIEHEGKKVLISESQIKVKKLLDE